LLRLDHEKEASILLVVDSKTGETLQEHALEGTKLRGVTHSDRDTVLFKLDNGIYSISVDRGKVVIDSVGKSATGWLVSSSRGGYIVVDHDTLYSFRDKRVQEPVQNSISALLESRDQVIRIFQEWIDSAHEEDISKKNTELIKGISTFELPCADIYLLIKENLETLKQSKYEELILFLYDRFADEIISHQGVQLRFGNFLSATKLIPAKKKKRKNEELMLPRKLTNYSVKGEALSLPTIDVLKGPDQLDCYFLLNNDQLLCVNETGAIRWSTTVLYKPLWRKHIGLKDDQWRGRFHADFLKISIIDTVVIINDSLNLVAYDIQSGKYLWSMTDAAGLFSIEEPESEQGDMFQVYGFYMDFLKKVMIYDLYDGERLIVVRGNKMKALDPLTGICSQTTIMNSDGYMQTIIDDKKLFALAADVSRIDVFNTSGKLLSVFPLKFLKKDEIFGDLQIAGDYLVLDTKKRIVVLDKKTGGFIDSLKMKKNKRYSVNCRNDDLFIYKLPSKLTTYDLLSGGLKKKWEYSIKKVNQIPIGNVIWRNSLYCLFIREKVIFLTIKNNMCSLSCVNSETGELLWIRSLGDFYGAFVNMTGYVQYSDTIYFALSCQDNRTFSKETTLTKLPKRVHMLSRLIGVDPDDGAIILNKKLPVSTQWGYEKIGLIQTKQYMCFVSQGKYFNAQQKK